MAEVFSLFAHFRNYSIKTQAFDIRQLHKFLEFVFCSYFCLEILKAMRSYEIPFLSNSKMTENVIRVSPSSTNYKTL